MISTSVELSNQEPETIECLSPVAARMMPAAFPFQQHQKLSYIFSYEDHRP